MQLTGPRADLAGAPPSLHDRCGAHGAELAGPVQIGVAAPHAVAALGEIAGGAGLGVDELAAVESFGDRALGVVLPELLRNQAQRVRATLSIPATFRSKVPGAPVTIQARCASGRRAGRRETTPSRRVDLDVPAPDAAEDREADDRR